MRAASFKVLVIALSLLFPLSGFTQDTATDYINLGLAKLKVSDFDGAIADYDRAIELESGHPTPFLCRASANQAKGDLEAALADYNRAIEIDPQYAYSYQCRAILGYLTRNWAEALRDYKRSCELSDKGQGYTRIHIWLIQTRQGETETADKDLAAYLEKQKNAGQATWATKIAGYLLGNLTEADLLAAAQSPDAEAEKGQLCELWYYAGMKKLLAGSKAAAGVYLRKCRATNIKVFVEYQFAEAELKALGQ